MPDISLDRFSGFADEYELVRPVPPAKLCGILLAWSKAIQVDTVLDLGCGTGLSTRLWLPFARRVIGVEPNADMRAVAIRQSRDIEYRDGSSYATGQEADSTDIVTCSQSFHWMEPTETIREVSRILRPGGLFAVYDNHWPPGRDIHEMGGCRMGKDPKTSLLNKWNQLHACPNVFVTDGACMTSTANQSPSILYMALTARAVTHAVEEIKKGQL